MNITDDERQTFILRRLELLRIKLGQAMSDFDRSAADHEAREKLRMELGGICHDLERACN